MLINKDDVYETVLSVLNAMIEDWDDDMDDPVRQDTLLVEDVGFASIDFVQFVVAVEEKFDAKFGFQELLMQNGKYVEDLSFGQVVDFVFGKLSTLSHETSQNSIVSKLDKNILMQLEDDEKVNQNKFSRFKEIIRPCMSGEVVGGDKNDQAIFVLSPPRSGSTLLRVMLAGNPELFAPPELHLLSYNTMEERHAALNNEHNHHLLEGTIRAMMQLKGWDAEKARHFSAGCEQAAMATREFYALMQEPLEGRKLVDKTPTYVVNTDILQRAERDFENPLYIHLLRHPCGMMRSYEESRLTRMMPLMQESDFSARELAEMTWLISQKNTLDFLAEVPDERQYAIKYEDIVQSPEMEMRKLCGFMGVEFNEAMINPYESTGGRMTDGVDTASKMSGDLKFHLHQGIDSEAAYRWQQFCSEDMLGDITLDVARQLGYCLDDEAKKAGNM